MLDNSTNTLAKYSPVVLRLGLGAVIFWFGLNEVFNPSAWISYIPAWATSFGLSSMTVLYLNGMFEIVAGIFLTMGIFTRIVSFLLFLHMILIVIDVGLTSIGMRDVGLAAALLSLAMHDKDQYSLV